jgi:signal transduction histidine kinase
MRLVRRLTLWLLLVVGVVFAADTYLGIRQHVDFFEADLRRDERHLGRALAYAIGRAWRESGRESALELVRGADDSQSAVRIRLVHLSDEPGTPFGPDLPDEARVAVSDAHIVFHVREDGEDTRFYTYLPLDVPQAGGAALELSESIETERAYLRSQIRNRLVSVAILFATCAAVAWIVGTRVVGRPIQRLVDKARRIGAGDFSDPLALPPRDEISQLAGEIDAMAAALEAGARDLAAQSAARIAALEQLHHADRLSTVGKLASGLAHELGTPLNVVSGRARMIADGEVEAGEPTAAAARIIVDQTERMTRIVRQLLDFARRRAGDKRDTDLALLARQVVALLEPLAAQSGVSLRFEAPEQGVRARVDPHQLHQAITNLVMNAIQAGKRGGKVSVRLAQRVLHCEDSHPDAREVLIEVRDDGSGIAPGDLPLIFDPFFTRRSVGEGTGLGLSVAQSIVAEHGGRIEVESEPGRGSVFQIRLAAAAQ